MLPYRPSALLNGNLSDDYQKGIQNSTLLRCPIPLTKLDCGHKPFYSQKFPTEVILHHVKNHNYIEVFVIGFAGMGYLSSYDKTYGSVIDFP